MTRSVESGDLASFLPRLELQALAERAHGRVDALHCSRRAAALFVDVAGFSRLTEDLARQGQEGAELVSRIIDRCFGRITDIVLAAGGDVICYPGDAALVVWPVEKEAELETVRRTARTAAQAIQHELDGQTTLTGDRLHLRSTVGSGSLELRELGGRDDRWLLLVGGTAIRDATGGGSPIAAARVEPPVAADRGPVPSLALELLPKHVPAVVAGRLGAGQRDWLAEFRSPSVVFFGLPDEPATLQESVRSLQDILARFEGTIYQFLRDDKGTSLVAAFGLPPYAHEDDPARALRAAVEAADQNDVAVGIATGRMWCGVYGNRKRRQYTMVGSTINLAARLMQASVRGVLCDETTAALAHDAVACEPLAPVPVKGRSTPVPVFRPSRGVTRPTPRSAPRETAATGRREETGRFLATLQRVRRKEPSVPLFVEGAPGLGKTQLVRHWLTLAEAAGVRVLGGSAPALDSATPYAVWQSVFEPLLLGDAAAGSQDELRRHVQRRLATWVGREELAPLLAPVLSIDFAPSEATAHSTEEVRAARTRRLLVEILEHVARASPTLLALEDAHWFDSASWALLIELHRTALPLAVVVTARPPDAPSNGMVSFLEQIRPDRLHLTALGPNELLQIVARRLGVRTLPSPLEQLLCEKASGNPLHATQLAFALRESGAFQIDGDRCILSEELDERAGAAAVFELLGDVPAGLDGAIVSRLDRLPHEHQLTLKVASVLGRTFSSRELQATHPARPDAGELARQLTRLTARGLVAEAAEGHEFESALTQEIVYASMPFEQRRKLHRTVAERRERTASSTPDRYAILAHHWRRSATPERAVPYLALAGEHALVQHANAEAVRFLSEALELAPHAADSARRTVQLGRAYVNWSRLEEGRTRLEEGLRSLSHPVPHGNVGAIAGCLRESVLQMAWRLRPRSRHSAEAARAAREAARAWEGLVEAYYIGNEKLRCLHAALRALNCAEHAGPSGELARGYASFGAILGFLALHRWARRYLRRARAVAERAGDPEAQAWTLLSAAVYASGRGAWRQAEGGYEEAEEISRRIEDHRRGDDSALALATVLTLRGQLGRARAIADRCYDGARSRRDSRSRGSALRIRIACGAIANGANEIVEDAAEMAEHFHPASGAREQDLGGAAAMLAWCELSRGRLDDARRWAERSLPVLLRLDPFFPLLVEYTALADVALALEDGEGDLTADVDRLIRSYARAFPIGEPARLWLAGHRERRRGRPQRAAARFRKAVESGRRLGLPLYAHRAAAELADA